MARAATRFTVQTLIDQVCVPIRKEFDRISREAVPDLPNVLALMVLQEEIFNLASEHGPITEEMIMSSPNVYNLIEIPYDIYLEKVSKAALLFEIS